MVKKHNATGRKNTKQTINKTTPLKKENKKPIYISYPIRVAFLFIIFIVFLLTCFYLAINSFTIKNTEPLKYTDNQTVDYKVYLKPNDFYEKEYLEKNMMYVANLIDEIKFDFNYQFNITKPLSLDFDYQIIGKLIIANPQTKASYFEKEYPLFTSSLLSMQNQKDFTITESIAIDYDYYNSLVNNFKTNYGVNEESYLKVYLKVNKNGQKYHLNFQDTSTSGVTIPLSESAVQIKFDDETLNKSNELSLPEEWQFNPLTFSFEIITFIIAILALVNLLKLTTIFFKPKTAYDKYLNNILKTYDRLIVETKTKIDFNKYHIFKITEFTELLDVRDNLKIPIMYYNVTKHQKCYFYLKNNDDIYLLQLKASDIERPNINEKK